MSFTKLSYTIKALNGMLDNPFIVNRQMTNDGCIFRLDKQFDKENIANVLTIAYSILPIKQDKELKNLKNGKEIKDIDVKYFQEYITIRGINSMDNTMVFTNMNDVISILQKFYKDYITRDITERCKV